MSSAYYKAKIDEFVQMKASINSVASMAPGASSAIKKAAGYMEELIVGGEPIDKGIMSGSVLSAMTDAVNLLVQLSSECDQMIAKYTDLYYSALKKEQEQAAKKFTV